MSREFLAAVIACLVIFGAVMTTLFYQQGELIDKLLWPQQVEMECVPPEQARARKARCVVIEGQTA